MRFNLPIVTIKVENGMFTIYDLNGDPIPFVESIKIDPITVETNGAAVVRITTVARVDSAEFPAFVEESK